MRILPVFYFFDLRIVRRIRKYRMIARIFPRKTTATPDDALAFFDAPNPDLDYSHISEIHVSVTFSYDLDKASKLAESWEHIAPVKIGGPALGDRGDVFVPGRYLKPGYVISSRGCPNNCWFCDVHTREGDIRELPITQGYNLLDSNILACSIDHVRKVFKMLKDSGDRVQLTGGLEAKILTYEHVKLLWDLRPKQMFFAYDTPDDYLPLVRAGELLRFANFTRQHLRCYVLIGWPKDTMEDAEIRIMETWEAGFMPMAMLWKNKAGDEDVEWRRLQKIYARPAMTKAKMRELFANAVGNNV
jgi:hypothetical protein